MDTDFYIYSFKLWSKIAKKGALGKKVIAWGPRWPSWAWCCWRCLFSVSFCVCLFFVDVVCFLFKSKSALAIGVSAMRKKMRTMTRRRVVLSVIFILTKCLWEEDVLNFLCICKQKKRRRNLEGRHKHEDEAPPCSQGHQLNVQQQTGVGGEGFQITRLRRI